MRYRKGFTLIELILALALISILLMIIVPKTSIFSTYYKNMELNTIKRDLYATRSRAVSEGVTYSFNVSDGGYEYYFIGKDGKVTRRVSLNKIRILTSSRNPFYFNSLGNVSGSTTMNLQGDEGEGYELKIGVATGKITIVKVKE